MLVVKVFVNLDQIDEIHIQNTGDVDKEICNYQIMRPEGFETYNMKHKRSDGYLGLLEQALKILKSTGYRASKYRLRNKTIVDDLRRFFVAK